MDKEGTHIWRFRLQEPNYCNIFVSTSLPNRAIRDLFRVLYPLQSSNIYRYDRRDRQYLHHYTCEAYPLASTYN